MSSPVTMEAMVPRFQNAFRSDRLVFTPMEDTDAIKTFMNDELAQENVGEGLSNPMLFKPRPKSASDSLVSNFVKGTDLSVMICLPPTKISPDDQPTMIGYLTLNKDLPWHRSTSIALRITIPHQNKGYGREAVNWALDWAFRWGNMHRVTIGTVAFNERAVALYRSIGFVEETRLRKVAYFDLKWHDMVGLAMLEDEWRALRGIEAA